MESGSYVQEITKELVVVSFNSVYFSIRNNASNDPGIAEKILKWVERQLLQARQKKQKVILVYHIPHGTYITPVKEECFWVHEYQNEIFRIEREYSETISAIFTGHIHSSYLQSVEQARLLRPSARQQTQAAPEYFGNLVVMRAVAPIFQNNPGFAIFTYENSNFSYFSYYDDYTFLLSRAINTIEDPQHFWTQLYNSRRDLGLENLSAAGIAQFIRTLPFDPQKLIKYMFYKIGEPFKPAYSRSELAVQVCGAAELNPIRTSICANELLGELNRTVPGQR